MEVLWDRSPISAAEVCEAICADRDWSIPTAKTLLSWLVQKEAVGTEPQGRKFLYRPLIARADYVGVESRRLVNRLFGGRAAVAQLAESEALTDDDLTEIEALLRNAQMTELIKAGWDGFLFDTLMWTGALIALVVAAPARHFGAGAAYAVVPAPRAADTAARHAARLDASGAVRHRARGRPCHRRGAGPRRRSARTDRAVPHWHRCRWIR